MSSTPRIPSSRPTSASRPRSANPRDYERAWARVPSSGLKSPCVPLCPQMSKGTGVPPSLSSSRPDSAAAAAAAAGGAAAPTSSSSAAASPVSPTPPASNSSNVPLMWSADQQELIFHEIMDQLATDTTHFSSFAVACDAAMCRAEVACKDMPHPKQLEAGVAATLLLKLSPHLGLYSNLVHRLALCLIRGCFETLSPSILESSPTSIPADREMTSIVRTASYGTRCRELEASLASKDKILNRQREKTMYSVARMCAAAERKSAQRLRLAFLAWRRMARHSQNFSVHLISLRAVQTSVTRKREAFLRWVASVHSLKEARATSLAASNHDLLSGRLGELNSRCTQREDQMVSQRVAKEKYAARCDRLEELYAYEKEELAKCRTKLLSTEQEILRFRQMAIYMAHVFDRMTSTVPMFLSSQAMQEVVKGSLKRDLNIKRGVQPIKLPTIAAPAVPHRLLITSEYAVPYEVHGGGGVCFEEYVDDVYLAVQRWLNIARDETRQFVEQSRTQAFVNAKDAFAASMEDDDLQRAFLEVEMCSKPIRDFARDLADGRAYQLILWRLLCHRYGGTAFFSNNAPVAPFIACESSSERMDLVLKMAKLLGLDGGESTAQLLEISSEGRRRHFLFACRIMNFQATCTPHFIKLQSSRLGHLPTALTSSHLMQMVQSASEKLDVLERWNAVLRAVNNYAASIASGVAQLDVGSHRSPYFEKEFLVDKTVVLEQTIPQHLKFVKPLSAAQNTGGFTNGTTTTTNTGTAAAGGGGGTSPMRATTTTATTNNNSDESNGASSSSTSTSNILAASFLVSEANHLFAIYAKELQAVQWFYGALTSPDVADCVWDTPAWFRFVQDTRLNTNRHVTKQASDAVFRSLAAPSAQTQAAAIVALQPAQLQPRLATSFTTTASGSSSGVNKTPRTGTASGGGGDDAAASGAGGGGDGMEDGSAFYQMPSSKLPVAIMRLFLARSLNPQSPGYGWTDVDRAVELFREFLVTVILAPTVSRSPIEQFLSTFHHPSVQEVFKQHREPLRRIFTEIATRDPVTQLNRIRMDSFVHFITRDAKIMSINETSDVQCVYQTCRIAGMTLSPLKGAALSIPGLDAGGFHIALMLLSRIKYGFPMVPQSQALQQFFSTILYPACQFKMKLKW